jgi:ABC-type transporter Mla MlaB component
MGVDQSEDSVSLVLRGEILGDATLALEGLDAEFVHGNLLAIDCGKLIRVDFAAAGSILNWVAERESGGKQVQFQNVHRLVAAFFNVIGINEHARVIPRVI